MSTPTKEDIMNLSREVAQEVLKYIKTEVQKSQSEDSEEEVV